MKSFKAHIQEVYLPPEIKQFRHNVLHTEKKPHDSNPDHWKRVGKVTEYMAKYGWNLLGNGAFARAYGHPGKNYIIKLFSDDRGYDVWLDFMQTHQGNPLVPKLRGKPVRIADDIWAVRMERLTPLSANEYTYVQYIGHLSAIWDRHELDHYFDGKDTDLPYAEKWWDQIFTFLDKYRFHTDIHPGNVMLRGKQLVITDPLAIGVDDYSYNGSNFFNSGSHGIML